MRTVKKLSNLMLVRNIKLSQAKELLYWGKIDVHGKARINWNLQGDEDDFSLVLRSVGEG